MKMQHTYGIFQEEIEPLLALVFAHEPLDVIESVPCPCCGANITVGFSDDGGHFQVSCKGNPPHWSVLQPIPLPPPWWQERVQKFEPVTYYWTQLCCFREDGTLEM